jgi:hypothetical protein
VVDDPVLTSVARRMHARRHPHGHPTPRKRAWCCIKHTRRDPPTPDPGRALAPDRAAVPLTYNRIPRSGRGSRVDDSYSGERNAKVKVSKKVTNNYGEAVKAEAKARNLQGIRVKHT